MGERAIGSEKPSEWERAIGEEKTNEWERANRRALPGETEVLAFFIWAGLNNSFPPPVWVASAVIGQVASRLKEKGHFLTGPAAVAAGNKVASSIAQYFKGMGTQAEEKEETAKQP